MGIRAPSAAPNEYVSPASQAASTSCGLGFRTAGTPGGSTIHGCLDAVKVWMSGGKTFSGRR